jgi:hypothetical protein
MAANCASCGTKLEPGDTFCQNCGKPVTATHFATQSASPTSSMLGRFERAVYFRIARGFSWVLMVVALAGFFYSLVSALQSAGGLVGTQRSVSQEEVQASIANEKAGRGNQFSRGEETSTDPRLVGEYETALAELVNLLPSEVRRQAGSDEAARNQLRSMFSSLGKDIGERISVAKEAKGVLQSFAEKDRGEAIGHFRLVKQHKNEAAEMRKAEAKEKFTYLGGAILSTAILITLFSMILVLLAIERNTRVIN